MARRVLPTPLPPPMKIQPPLPWANFVEPGLDAAHRLLASGEERAVEIGPWTGQALGFVRPAPQLLEHPGYVLGIAQPVLGLLLE